MNEKELSALIMSKIKGWQTSQEGQTSGYDYEKSLSQMVKGIGVDIMQSSLGVIPSNRKLKKR